MKSLRHTPQREPATAALRRRPWLVASVFSLCAAAFAAEPRPNILHLFTDDHSVRTLSCYADTPGAYPWARTPHIDRLAAQGVRFASCYPGALCRPSRGTALTGRLQSGYTTRTPYWPARLREHGYHTGMIGKWHWHTPQHGTAWDWSVVWPHGQGSTAEDDGNDYYLNQKVSINGAPLVPLGGYSTDRYADHAVEFLQKRAADRARPWYLWVCFAGVHAPYTPAERHRNDYADATAPVPADIFGPRPEKPPNLLNFSRWTRDADGEPVMRMGGITQPFNTWVRQYNQAVRALDEAVGRIMHTLEETGQAANTIVVLTADQGFAWGEHGFRDKTAPYDANLLAPLIVSHPSRFARGSVSREPVNGPDIVATLHSLAGLRGIPTDGRDFTPLLDAPERRDWTDSPMIQIHTGGKYGDEALATALRAARDSGDWSGLIAEPGTGTRTWLMLREGRYKYVRYAAPGFPEELFDLTRDPHELTNLALRREHHALLAAHREKLLATFAARGATWLDLLPPPRIHDEPPTPDTAPTVPAATKQTKKRGK